MEVEVIRNPKKSYNRRFDHVSDLGKPGDCIVIHGFNDPGYDTTETLATAVMIAMEKIERMII